ncbi:YfhE family protein [Virgibacillus ainsalahensis]
MNQKSKQNQRDKFLSKTQEVHYQKEFKHADRLYNQLSQRRNRS